MLGLRGGTRPALAALDAGVAAGAFSMLDLAFDERAQLACPWVTPTALSLHRLRAVCAISIEMAAGGYVVEIDAGWRASPS